MRQNERSTPLELTYRLRRRELLRSLGVAGLGGVVLLGLENLPTYAKGPRPGPKAYPFEGATYKIVSVSSGKVLDVPNFAAGNGALIQQFQDDGGANQHWQILPAGNGVYKIVSASSGKVLDVPDFAADNRIIQQFQDNGGANQHWQVLLVKGDIYKITSISSGKVLDVPDFATGDGTLIQQFQDNGGANQRWRLVQVS